jgi:general secretion pathway protein D
LLLGAAAAVGQTPPDVPGGSPLGTPGVAPSVPGGVQPTAEGLVQLDFNDVELSVVIDTIARLTSKNFIYDDRVRGRVTIVSPTKVTVDQAYRVFESVLQVKGFTTVDGPGGSIKIIPVRDAKESPIGTVPGPSPTPFTDTFVTRLIPLKYIDAEAISNSLKPLVSKDAALVAYAPTNTIILTDAASNIRRILEILAAIDVETYKEELAVIKVEHADAATLAQQLGDIYGGEVSQTGGAGGALAARVRPPQVPGQVPQVQTGEVQRDRVRIITDGRTNSLIVLASRTKIEDIRRLVTKLDVPVTGGGRIHVYYLRNANAEDLAETLNALISGQPAAGKGGKGAGQGAAAAAAAAAQAQALRAAVTELAEGVTVTADKSTNSLVIQASQEGFSTLAAVIEKLDIRRPQVLVEALIMEITSGNSEDLGFNGLFRLQNGNTGLTFGSLTDAGTRQAVFPIAGSSGTQTPATTTTGTTTTGTTTPTTASGALQELSGSVLSNLVGMAAQNSLTIDPITGAISGGSLIAGLIRASASVGGTNILSAPHILTSDNEKAEIKIGSNIPIVSSRVQSAAGIQQQTDNGINNLATSVNIERQDIGITLRVEPQITEGDTLRMEIFQEISNIDPSLTTQVAGSAGAAQTGVALSTRKVENNVVVADGETVVIGGLISDNYRDTVDKVPWLGDIPILGWAFKTTSRQLAKTNLLIFLTPHIIRDPVDLEKETIRKREEFRQKSAEAIELTESERKEEDERREEATNAGMPYEPGQGRNPARKALDAHEQRYPLERMKEIEEQQKQRKLRGDEEAGVSHPAPRYVVTVALYRDEHEASAKLQELLDAGYDASLVATSSGGVILYEIRVGPYDTTDEAERVAAFLRENYGVSPKVVELAEGKE